EAPGVLAAAVQHHQWGQPLVEPHAGRTIEPEATRAARTHGDARDPVARAGWRRAFLDDRPERLADDARAGGEGVAGRRDEAAFKALGPCGAACSPCHQVNLRAPLAHP